MISTRRGKDQKASVNSLHIQRWLSCLHTRRISTNSRFTRLLIHMSFVRYVKLQVPAGSAKPGPAIGQALGPLGINMADFCKQFNERTAKTYVRDVPLNVRLHAMSDRSFKFDVRTPSTSYLIRKVVGMDKGPTSVDPLKPTAFIAPEEVYEIAKIKHIDDQRWHLPLESVARSVVATAKNMGIECREKDE
jgi:large subunit ribosomal protein L11